MLSHNSIIWQSCINDGKKSFLDGNSKWKDSNRPNAENRKVPYGDVEKEKNKHFYEITKHESETLINEIIHVLSNKIMENEEIKLLYGTRALILLAKDLPNKWQNLALNLTTTDIDIAVKDPSKLGNQIFHELVNIATLHKFIVSEREMYITKIFLSKKTDDLYSLSIEVRVKIDDDYFMGRDAIIMDISSLKNWSDNTIYKISEKVSIQHPLHFICGLIDKLFNTRINPRIEDKNRKGSMLVTKEKLKKLNLPIISDEDKILIESFIQDNSELLSAFKNKISMEQAKITLFSVLDGICDFTIFDNWYNMYPLMINKLVLSLSKNINKHPAIVCSMSFMDLINNLVENFDTLAKFVKYIKKMRGYRNTSYETENFIIVKFRYVDGFPNAWTTWAFYMRGSIVAINKKTKEIILLKMGPSKGFETGYKSHTGETQDLKKGSAHLTFEQQLLRETLIENANTPLCGELNMKIDGSLLSILRIPKKSIQYLVFSEIFIRYSTSDIENEYIQFLLNLDDDYLYVPMSQNTDIVKINEGFFPTMITAMCGPLGKNMWEKSIGTELEKLMILFQINFPIMINKIKEINILDVQEKVTSYYFEAVCMGQTTLNDKKIPDLALSYDESNLYFLGVRQFNTITFDPYLPASNFNHTFLIPMYWQIKTPNEINQIVDALSSVLSGSKTEEEFLDEFPSKGSNKLHFEGFVLLLNNLNGIEFSDPLYAKLKSPFWYELHKPGKDIIEIINKLNPKYCELFPLIGLIQLITPELVEQLLDKFQLILDNNVKIYLNEVTEELIKSWGTNLNYSQFKRMKEITQIEKILIFTDIIVKSVKEIFGLQFSRFCKILEDSNHIDYKLNMKFFRTFLNPCRTKSKQEFICELVELLKKQT